MRTLKSILVVAFAASFWAGCGDSSTDTPPGQSCTPGQSVACTGPGGCASTQVCSQSGTVEACVCGGSDAGSDAATGAPGLPLSVVAAKVTVTSTVSTLAGSAKGFADGTGEAAMFSTPIGVPVDAAGNVFVGDNFNNRIRKVTPAGEVTTLAGLAPAFLDGTGAGASFNGPAGGAVDAAGNVYVADRANNRIRKVTSAGVVTTLAGSGAATFADGVGVAASFSDPNGVALDAAGNVYVADLINQRIRKITPAGAVTTLAGSGVFEFADGTGDKASFRNPSDVAVDLAGNVYVADRLNHRIRKVTPAGVVTTLAGSGNPSFAGFDNPIGVAVDLTGNIYVADNSNHRIRRLTQAGVMTTHAGSGAETSADGPGNTAGFSFPQGVAVDATGNVYVGDTNNHRIRKVRSVGIGQLAVKWDAPAAPGSTPITGYTASASATGNPTKTCTTDGPTFCTISGLTSGVPYTVSVTATNAGGTSEPGFAPNISAN